MPKNREFRGALTSRLEPITLTLLLPLFFACSGLRAHFGLLSSGRMWFYCALIVAVAIGGKLAGCAMAARANGIPWREASAIGVLMNTRGLIELVILNVGLDLGVISPAVFSMMVLMALLTTYMTTPLLHWLYPTVGEERSRAASCPDG